MPTRIIVVGVDGSDTSLAAVRWAAREAQRREAVLRIVHAFDWEWHAARYSVGGEFLEAARRHADTVAATAARDARAAAPAIHVQPHAAIGDPVPQLLDGAADAELLVLATVAAAVSPACCSVPSASDSPCTPRARWPSCAVGATSPTARSRSAWTTHPPPMTC
jgi:nucleotide-binding universal stress UspA family protein